MVERKKMMEDYADYFDSLAADAATSHHSKVA